MAFYKLDDCVSYITNALDTNKASLGINAVLYGDQKITKATPAAFVAGNHMGRTLDGTHQFLLEFDIYIYLATAKIATPMGERQQDIIQVAESVSDFLHADTKLGNNIVFGYVRDLHYGTLGRSQGTEMYVGARLWWRGLNKQIGF